MRLKTAALALSALLVLAGCASQHPHGHHHGAGHPMAAAHHSCEHPRVPAGAVFGTANGRDIATFPPEVPDHGCQRVWHGQRAQPAEMQVLATYHYRGGQVAHLSGQVPGGPAYECRYRQGTLDAAASRNAQHCPSPQELQRRR